MAKYRKKPVVIEAYQLPIDPDKDNAVAEFLGWAVLHEFKNWFSSDSNSIEIHTLEGVMMASPGDWIIKGIEGEFYPCKPDIFAKTYDLVADVPAAP